jgi:hypothetical protein
MGMTDGRRMTWKDFQPDPEDGPPIDVLPGYMDSSHVLALTDDVAIAAAGFRVWDVGFLFTLSVRLSPEGYASLPEPAFAWFRPERPTLFLEMRWPNGRRVSNVKEPRPGARHTLQLHGGSSSGPRYDVQWWVAPLPRLSGITVACAWPEANIPEATVDVPEHALREAASRQVRLWT